uniref:Myb/SANT-like DNA-binding domain-containing protein n=1 Tax=Leersia perrieri TaxID=77586 RepID=A0A0D9WJN8_9ORYZ
MEVREMAVAAAAAAAAATGGGGGGLRLPPPNPNLPYREDCWSDGETAALVCGAHPPRTDVQCKNRVDTLKKKYKAERLRTSPSTWSFYGELDRLVGPTLSASAAKRPSPSSTPSPVAHFALPIHPSAVRKPPSPSSASPSPPPPMALPLPNYRRGSPLPAAALIMQEAAAAAAAAVSDSEDSEGLGHNMNINNNNNINNAHQSPSQSVSSRSGNSNKRSRREAVRGDEGGFRELARAIEAFSEMYERVESAKQKQALEIERQRIDFLKQLEVKRMENFVDAHVKLARAKRIKKKHSGAAQDDYQCEVQ